MAIGLVALFLGLFIALGAFIVWRSYEDASLASREKARAGAQVVAANIGWVVETSHQILARIDATIGDSLQSLPQKAVDDLGASIRSLPGEAQIYLVGANGVTVFSTDPEWKPIDITDREYFAALQAGAQF